MIKETWIKELEIQETTLHRHSRIHEHICCFQLSKRTLKMKQHLSVFSSKSYINFVELIRIRNVMFYLKMKDCFDINVLQIDIDSRLWFLVSVVGNYLESHMWLYI